MMLGYSKTLKREVSALVEASKELKCDNLIIITNSVDITLEEFGCTIQIQSFATFNRLNELLLDIK